MSTEEFQIIMRRLDSIERKMTPAAKDKWVDEAEAMRVTGLSKSSLRKKRAAGVLHFATATGKKIKYLRSQLEDYIEKNSTIV